LKYYEFNKTDYYALLAVKEVKTDNMIKAMKLYVKYVAYDSVDELRANSMHPKEISKNEALLKFLMSPSSEEMTVKNVVKQFNDCEDSVLLIDGSLL